MITALAREIIPNDDGRPDEPAKRPKWPFGYPAGMLLLAFAVGLLLWIVCGDRFDALAFGIGYLWGWLVRDLR